MVEWNEDSMNYSTDTLKDRIVQGSILVSLMVINTTCFVCLTSWHQQQLKITLVMGGWGGSGQPKLHSGGRNHLFGQQIWIILGLGSCHSGPDNIGPSTVAPIAHSNAKTRRVFNHFGHRHVPLNQSTTSHQDVFWATLRGIQGHGFHPQIQPGTPLFWTMWGWVKWSCHDFLCWVQSRIFKLVLYNLCEMAWSKQTADSTWNLMTTADFSSFSAQTNSWLPRTHRQSGDPTVHQNKQLTLQ